MYVPTNFWKHYSDKEYEKCSELLQKTEKSDVAGDGLIENANSFCQQEVLLDQQKHRFPR